MLTAADPDRREVSQHLLRISLPTHAADRRRPWTSVRLACHYRDLRNLPSNALIANVANPRLVLTSHANAN